MSTDPMRTFNRMMRPLQRKLQHLIARASVDRIDDSRGTQQASVSLSEDESATVEHFQPYGFTSHAGGGEGVFLTVGDRSHGILICVMRRDARPVNLAEGEVALYTSTKPQVLCRPDGSVHIGVPDGPEFMVLGTSLANWLKTHTHPTSMGPSGVPVQAATVDQCLSTLHRISDDVP